MGNGMQVPLNLPDARLLSTQRTEQGHGLIRVESPRDGAQCRRCGREMRDLQGWEAVVRRRHLPLCAVPVFVEMRPKRSRGPCCSGHPTPTPRCAWYEPRSPHTTAYEPWAVRLLINSTVADAARQLGVSAETIDGLLDRWLERGVDGEAWARLGGIGLDESARPRGPRDVVVWVTVPLAAGGVELVAVRADRPKETVAAVLRTVPATRRRPLERAGTERYAGFGRALAAEVPWAALVSERFHVARAYCDGADTGRTTALQRRKSAWPKAEDAAITGGMWPLRKRPGELAPQERARRARVFSDAPPSEAAAHLRDDLTARCARGDTQAGAKRAIRAWGPRVRQRGLSEFERFLGTRHRWIEAITHSGMGRQTSGFVEGFTNRVQGLKRRCDGIFNVGSLFQRLTLAWHGYQRFGHT